MRRMIDLQKEDERLINEALKDCNHIEYGALVGGKSLLQVLQELIEKKNKLFEEICKERVNTRVEEIAQEKAKDANGIPVRTLIAKDILTTIINSGNLKARLKNEDLARISVDMTDELLKALKK